MPKARRGRAVPAGGRGPSASGRTGCKVDSVNDGSGPSDPSEVSVGQDPARLTLGHFLSDVAARHADRDALVFEGRRIRYDELHAEAVQLARCLVGAGVVKGARVAVLMPNRPEWVTAAFAVGMIGGVLVPLNTFATPRERDHMLRHSDATLLLMQASLLRRRYADELIEGHPEIAEAAPGQIRCRALPQLAGQGQELAPDDAAGRTQFNRL